MGKVQVALIFTLDVVQEAGAEMSAGEELAAVFNGSEARQRIAEQVVTATLLGAAGQGVHMLATLVGIDAAVADVGPGGVLTPRFGVEGYPNG